MLKEDIIMRSGLRKYSVLLIYLLCYEIVLVVDIKIGFYY